MLHYLASFAIQFNVAATDAYVLPALFENAAQKVNMTPSALVKETFSNAKLGEHMAELARTVANMDRKAA